MFRHPLDADFETWWQNCWRKIGKGYARRAYVTARRIADAQTLLDAAAKFRQVLKERDTPTKFQPHPASWLNAERWLDDDEAIKPVFCEQIHGLTKATWRAQIKMWRDGLMPWHSPGNPPGSGGYLGPVDLMTAQELESERKLRSGMCGVKRPHAAMENRPVTITPAGYPDKRSPPTGIPEGGVFGDCSEAGAPKQ